MNHALIIDDDRDTAELINLVLGLIGLECKVVHTAKAALAFLSNAEPEIIMLDMRLGIELSGSDILYQIRSNPRLDKTRVIVITAYPLMAEPVYDLADLVLIKPIDIEQLKLLVARLSSLAVKTYKFRDPLTNLYTLSFFKTRLEYTFDRLKRHPEESYAVFAISLELKSSSVTSLPTEIQEYLLKVIADRLRKKFRPTDTFARLDDDRIILLCEDLVDAGGAQVIIQRLTNELISPFEIHKYKICLTPQIGHAIGDKAQAAAEDVLTQALWSLEHSENISTP